jgi:hypothetical protein
MRSGMLWCLCLGLALVGGCSRQKETTNCEPTTRYTTARSAAPVQIPDDLSPPNENDALRLPPDSVASSSDRPEGACLESPPAFSRNFRPGRREAEPAAATPPPAEQPPEPAEPPADPSRVIDN